MAQPASQPLHIVTGAFGFTGRYIAQRLLDAGHCVRTLTNSPHRPAELANRIEVCPFNFADESRLVESLRGGEVLYNTYWVRFNHGDFRYATAVDNSLALFRAARKAGVRRVVHVSITNPSPDSPWEYFRGKARLEQALTESDLGYAILRPAVLFAPEDILINNIAWCLRRFPLFPVFGDGQYRLRPIYVDDLARLAVDQGAAADNVVLDAVGPESFTYYDLVQMLARMVDKRPWIVRVPPTLGYLAGLAIGRLVGDVVVTRDEIQGLMAGLLDVPSPPTGHTKLSEWAQQHAATLGTHYASELARRKRAAIPASVNP